MASVAPQGPTRGVQRKSSSARGRLSREELQRRSQAHWEAYFANPGDATRNALVECYQSFVGDIVRRFATRLPRSVDRGDLETAGSVGLMSAVESFDPERGVRFESYCERRIKGALVDELRTQDWLPRPWRHRIERHKRTIERLRGERSRDPADGEVAEAMGMGPVEYQQVFGTGLPGQPTGSIHPGDEEDNSTLEVVPDLNQCAPDEHLTQEEILTLVAQRLTGVEYRILYLKYWEELPMREIGELAGLSESRVCKIHSRLMERLKERFRVEQDEGA